MHAVQLLVTQFTVRGVLHRTIQNTSVIKVSMAQHT